MINAYYENSLMAMAAYANLSGGNTNGNEQGSALKSAGMSQEQYSEFVELWHEVRVFNSISETKRCRRD